MINNYNSGKQRPISPHLQIYKFQITSALSITHRMTGIFLFLGLIFISWFFILTVFTPETKFYNYLNQFNFSIFGKSLYFLWSISFFFHFLNGIRHLFWDCGLGFEKRSYVMSGWSVVVISVFLTLLSWLFIFYF